MSDSESGPLSNCIFLVAPVAFGYSEPYQFEPQLTEEEVKKQKKQAAQKQVSQVHFQNYFQKDISENMFALHTKRKA